MNSAKQAVGQIRAFCRQYPDKLTAHELVGRTYLVLNELPGVNEKTTFLADHLDRKELAKMIDAACEVFGACESFSAVQGFKLGAVVFPADGDARTIALDDRLIPGEFVKELMHCRRTATGRSA